MLALCDLLAALILRRVSLLRFEQDATSKDNIPDFLDRIVILHRLCSSLLSALTDNPLFVPSAGTRDGAGAVSRVAVPSLVVLPSGRLLGADSLAFIVFLWLSASSPPTIWTVRSLLSSRLTRLATDLPASLSLPSGFP
jgi:hypothetical protein